MSKPAVLSSLGFVVLFTVHHDFWNWDNPALVFGFMPVGLAYHAGFSLVAAGYWYLTTRFAWPHSIEQWADEPNESAE